MEANGKVQHEMQQIRTLAEELEARAREVATLKEESERAMQEAALLVEAAKRAQDDASCHRLSCNGWMPPQSCNAPLLASLLYPAADSSKTCLNTN